MAVEAVEMAELDKWQDLGGLGIVYRYHAFGAVRGG